MNKPNKSVSAIFEGFPKISHAEKIAYLKYLNLVIERNPLDKKFLIRFRAKLEKALAPVKNKCRLN